MSYKNKFPIFIVLIALAISGCGPSEEEQQQREQARQDSLEQARQDSLEKVRRQRQDSLAQAAADSSREQRTDQSSVSFTENGRFTVQTESWRSQRKADKQAQMWKDRGYNQAFVVRYGTESTGNIWYRVRLGRVESREEAKQIQKNLKQEYQAQSWIAVAN